MMTLKIQNRPIGGSAFGGQPARDVPRFSERGSGENKTPVDAFVFARRQRRRREKVNTKFENEIAPRTDASVRALGTFDAKSERGDVQEIESSVDVGELRVLRNVNAHA